VVLKSFDLEPTSSVLGETKFLAQPTGTHPWNLSVARSGDEDEDMYLKSACMGEMASIGIFT